MFSPRGTSLSISQCWSAVFSVNVPDPGKELSQTRKESSGIVSYCLIGQIVVTSSVYDLN